ncbi:LacI family DNA-binding transcriptional regulator [Streptomyces sp. HNM0663]|uniref:LacI family DNA-binding transcriptional regulator n=1 Tax=Streptomyces chengmaiensis TaxID=3040919 RepID=A0ABT6HJV1_9ACTN|nr:LacI family DNA-binding transcriptional regulator [Streptomyces chengmaiensis]MDH2388159.1 LacI family DNA-binding transcriptional regulator [Streptomyces chengmaiensis]
MGYAEKRGTYYRGRYKIAPGKYGTVKDDQGRTVKFKGKREAEQAADAEEAKVRDGTRRDPSLGAETFGEYVNRWFEDIELADTTMQNYRREIETHLLPEFGERPLNLIQPRDITAWERKLKEAGYAKESIKTYRARLHLILADAVEEGLIPSNPAARRRGRGKRAGRSGHRGPEKVITSPLGILLIAERLAVLSGRDDEFVAAVLKGYTGMRFGEIVGLERTFVRRRAVRVEWQLVELDTGELVSCPPKDDSYRTLDTPEWLDALVHGHIARARPRPCPCHGHTYVFSSFGTVRRWGRNGQPTVEDVATLAGVSHGTVSNVLNRPAVVAEETRLRVTHVMAELGYLRGRTPEETAAHWRRKSFASRLFRPAVTGQYEKVGSRPGHPVPVRADSWMAGTLVQGRGASARATVCWVPIAQGLTPHGLRHSHRTHMEDLGTPKVLMDERMGHMDGSVSARYAHVTDEMRLRLMAGLTRSWEASLDARLAMCPRSSVAVLDALLQARAAEVFSQISPSEGGEGGLKRL